MPFSLKRSLSRINVCWLLAGLTGVFSLLVYSSIAPDRLSQANLSVDSGDFLAAILTKGIPHPTGYPTYVMLGILLQKIPISTPVFRGVLGSLIPAAIATALLAAWMGYVLGKPTKGHLLAALVSGVGWGISPLLFSQAVIVDVQGLQSFIACLFLWWVTLNLEGKSLAKRKLLLFLSFLLGVGCGNHATIVFFVPAGLAGLLVSFKRGLSWRFIFGEVLWMVLGWSVYLYLPIRASAYPPIDWGNPQTLNGFLWEVTGNPYRGLVFSVPSNVLWERIGSLARLFLDQFGALGLIAGTIGFIQSTFRDRWLRGILIWIFCAYIVFAIGYNTEDSSGYLIPSGMVFAIWAGSSIPSLWNVRLKNVPIGIFLALILALSILFRLPSTLSSIDARNQDQPARYAEQLLDEAPKSAIIFTSATEDTFPLWYYHFGLRYRPDANVIVVPLTQFVWYQDVLIHTYSDLVFPPVTTQDTPNTAWSQEIERLNPQRPVCFTHLSAEKEFGVDYNCRGSQSSK